MRNIWDQLLAKASNKYPNPIFFVCTRNPAIIKMCDKAGYCPMDTNDFCKLKDGRFLPAERIADMKRFHGFRINLGLTPWDLVLGLGTGLRIY